MEPKLFVADNKNIFSYICHLSKLLPSIMYTRRPFLQNLSVLQTVKLARAYGIK